VGIKIGIIGSEGFIGRELNNSLSRYKGHKIYNFGEESNSKFGQSNYSKINLNDIQKNKRIFESFDLIYYLATASIPASSFHDPLIDVNLNLIPFLNFLEAINSSKVKKVVFTSSGGTIYGASNNLINEESIKNPESPHGIIKLTMEYFLEYNLKKSGINYNIFRIANTYGENQNTSKGLGLINTILEKVILKKQIEIFGDGSFKRNYIYNKDVAMALSSVVNQNLEISEIYNLASSESYSINEVLEIIQEIIKEPLDVKYVNSRKSDLRSILIDNSKFTEAHPKFRFTEILNGIKNTYNHIKNNI
jgi:UDP-glucose 4-epimerase